MQCRIQLRSEGNTAIGVRALQNTRTFGTFGINNTAVGADTLVNNTLGSSNISLGYWQAIISQTPLTLFVLVPPGKTRATLAISGTFMLRSPLAERQCLLTQTVNSVHFPLRGVSKKNRANGAG